MRTILSRDVTYTTLYVRQELKKKLSSDGYVLLSIIAVSAEYQYTYMYSSCVFIKLSLETLLSDRRVWVPSRVSKSLFHTQQQA